MLKRNEYVKKIYGLSTQNEPGNDCVVSCNVRQYPDMYYIYKKFGNYFNIESNTFFLSNGCENAIKNVLLAIKPKTMCWCIPTWGMMDVYCEALDIKPLKKEFKYDNIKSEFITPNLSDIKCDCLYTNCGFTNYFKYNFNTMDLYNSDFNYNICDITYQNIGQMKSSIQVLKQNPKNIIVGSFDKLVGCGLRLGFAIYSKELHDRMSLQREQFINSCAFEWFMNTDFNISKNQYISKLKNIKNIHTINDNFITVVGNIDTTIPCVHFNVDGHDFTRFGIPNNYNEYSELKCIIETEK